MVLYLNNYLTFKVLNNKAEPLKRLKTLNLFVFQAAEKRFKTLESTKKDVHLLAGRSSSDNEFYFQVSRS